MTQLFPRFRSLLLSILLFAPTLAIAVEKTVLPDPVISGTPIIPRFYWIEDAARTLTINDVADEKFNGRFTLSNSDSLGLGLSGSAFWVRYTVVNSSGKTADWILENDHPLWDFVEFYAKDENGAWTMKRAGDHVPFAEREIAYRKSAFHAAIPPGAERTFFLRLYYEKLGSAKIRITLWPESAFHNGNTTEYILLGLYFGAMAVMFFYNLFLWLSVRDKSYPWYILYVLGISLCMFAYNGLAFQYLWPTSSYMADYAAVLFGFAGYFFAALFGRSFLETRRYTPRLDALFLLSAAVSLIGLASCLLNWWAVVLPLIYWVQVGAGALFIAISVIRLAQGYHPARFYLISWSAAGTGFVILTLKDLGYLPYNPLTLWAPQMGTWLDVILLSFALADRINFIMAEREKMTAKLVETTVSRDLLSAEVDERKRVEIELWHAKEQAESATKLKDQFLMLVSHDIRSPLYAIMLSLERVTDDEALPLPAKHKQRADGIHKAAMRIIGMAEKVLNLSRLQTGAIKIQRDPFEASFILTYSLESILAKAEEKGISVKNEAPDGLKISVDIDIFPQVIQNLVSNAIKFTQPGGVITLSVTENGAWNTITIRDTGVGISQSGLSNLFKPGVMFSLGTAGEKGTGLGLSLCKEIVEAHGGRIEVESRVGEGSAFHILLPTG